MFAYLKERKKDRKLKKIEEKKGKSISFILLINKTITNYKKNKNLLRIIIKISFRSTVLESVAEVKFSKSNFRLI